MTCKGLKSIRPDFGVSQVTDQATVLMFLHVGDFYHEAFSVTVYLSKLLHALISHSIMRISTRL
jgi:hypothetical protein